MHPNVPVPRRPGEPHGGRLLVGGQVKADGQRRACRQRRLRVRIVLHPARGGRAGEPRRILRLAGAPDPDLRRVRSGHVHVLAEPHGERPGAEVECGGHARVRRGGRIVGPDIKARSPADSRVARQVVESLIPDGEQRVRKDCGGGPLALQELHLDPLRADRAGVALQGREDVGVRKASRGRRQPRRRRQAGQRKAGLARGAARHAGLRQVQPRHVDVLV